MKRKKEVCFLLCLVSLWCGFLTAAGAGIFFSILAFAFPVPALLTLYYIFMDPDNAPEKEDEKY